MKCKELMSPNVVVARPDDSVREARQMMKSHGVHALPVVDARGKPLGMITATDLLREVSPILPISRLMTPHLISIPGSEDVKVAARKMREYKYHHLVVAEKGKLVGVLSAFDLLVALEHGESPDDSSGARRSSSTRTKNPRARPPEP